MNPKVSILDTKSGRYMVMSTNDALTQILLRDGVHEEAVLNLSRFILADTIGETVVLDIGANIGSYCIPLAREVERGVNIKLFSFEIQRQVFLQLCGNIFLNSLDNVFAYNFGIGAESKTIKIPKIDYAQCWNVGGYSITPEARSVPRTDFPNQTIIGEEDSEIRSIDELPFVPGANLVKLDVEGAEIDVLRGMQKYLELSGFPPIIFELWNFDWFEKQRGELLDFLARIGYGNISIDIGQFNHLAQHDKSIHPEILFHMNQGVINISKGKARRRQP